MKRMVLLLSSLSLALAGVQHIYILHTNDIHGALLPSSAWWMSRDFPPPLANAPGALTLIRDYRAEAAAKGYGFLLLDAGDVFRGAPLGDFTRGLAVVDYFNRAGYDAVGVGEQDFALGRGVLERMVAASDIPWLNANIAVPGSDTTPSFLRPNLILERGGIRVGIAGLTTSYNNRVIRDSLDGDLEVRNEEDVAREQVAELGRLGAEVIVGLTHIGHSYEQRLAERVAGFDVIIGGRSNTALNEPVETPRNHTIVCQAASKLTAVGFIDLSVDTETKRVVGYEGQLLNLYAEEVPMDLGYLSVLDSLQDLAEAGFDSVIGYSRTTLRRVDTDESPLGNLIADAMCEYADADIAVQNSSGIRADIREGEITYRDVFDVAPLGNTLVTGQYTAAQVREMVEVGLNGRYSIFQVSGLEVRYARSAPFGGRVREMKVGGEPLDPQKTYRVATNSYLAAGSGENGVFRDGRDVVDSDIPLRDIIADYIRAHTPVGGGVEGRLVRVDR